MCGTEYRRDLSICCFSCKNVLCDECCSDATNLEKSQVFLQIVGDISKMERNDSTFICDDYEEDNCRLIIGFINAVFEIDDYDYRDISRKFKEAFLAGTIDPCDDEYYDDDHHQIIVFCDSCKNKQTADKDYKDLLEEYNELVEKYDKLVAEKKEKEE
jgi:hypothetical protein